MGDSLSYLDNLLLTIANLPPLSISNWETLETKRLINVKTLTGFRPTENRTKLGAVFGPRPSKIKWC